MRKRCVKRIVWKPTQKSRVEEVRRWFKKSVTYEGEAYTIDAEQAEAVIILEADEGVIPKTHPDTRLYAVFGETDDSGIRRKNVVEWLVEDWRG